MTEHDDIDIDPETGAEADSDQLPAEDMLIDRGVDDLLDEGYSPPERPGAMGHDIADDDAGREASVEDRLAAELPDLGEEADDDENVGGELGDERAGRLVDPDEGTGGDVDSELIGDDVGIDGAGASAEEAAVHLIDPDET